MTLIMTMIQSFVPYDVHLLLSDRSAQGNRHRIMDEKPFITSTDVICIRTGERGTDTVQIPAARI